MAEGVPSIKKGKVFTKGKVIYFEYENNNIKEIDIWDGFKIKRFVFIRDSKGNIQSIETYERFA